MPAANEAETPFHVLIGRLPSLMLSTPDLETFLQEVASLSARSVEPGASCGITTRYNQHPYTVATSDPRAALVDEHQYGAGEGPCLEAMRTGSMVTMPDLETETRWPAFRAAAAERGLRCVLSLPLHVAGKPMGALNHYGFEQPHVFGPEQMQRGLLFAAQASTALTLTLRHLEQSELVDQLEAAIASRSVIDQAIGILMREQRCDAEAAFTLLRQHSQNNNRKLREVAADLIETMTGHPHRTPSPFASGSSDQGDNGDAK